MVPDNSLRNADIRGIPLLSVQWMNSWWCTDELSETCRFSCQNKFVKLVHLVGFIIKKLCCFVSAYCADVSVRKCLHLTMKLKLCWSSRLLYHPKPPSHLTQLDYCPNIYVTWRNFLSCARHKWKEVMFRRCTRRFYLCARIKDFSLLYLVSSARITNLNAGDW